MVNAHIAHDCHVGDHTILCNNAMLAGHILVGDHAVISGGAGLQHYVTVGRHAFVGGLAGVVHDCPPFMMTDGHPAHVRGVNAIGLARHKFEPETIKALERAFMLLFSKKAKNSSFAAGLEEVEATLGHEAPVMELVTFCRRYASAPAGRYAEATRHDDKRKTPTR
jgi:UDP-N-acetylglucosamine acyltransferase